jgi:hypothetical protein
MRPEVNAGPINRRRRPLNVGVDIGSRGVGEASGVGLALAVGDATGDGDGCCAARLSEQTTNRDIKSIPRAHAEIVINGGSFNCGIETNGNTNQTDQCFTNSSPRCLCRKSIVRCHASVAASST